MREPAGNRARVLPAVAQATVKVMVDLRKVLRLESFAVHRIVQFPWKSETVELLGDPPAALNRPSQIYDEDTHIDYTN